MKPIRSLRTVGLGPVELIDRNKPPSWSRTRADTHVTADNKQNREPHYGVSPMKNPVPQEQTIPQ